MRIKKLCNLWAWPNYYKKFIINSTEHKISTANKKIKVLKIKFFQTLSCCIYPAIKFINTNNCWQFNISEEDKMDA